MPRLELTFFGPFRAILDGQPLQTLRSARIQSLLAFLALEPGRPHPREILAAHFWPDEPEEAAKQNLRQALYQLRQRLGDDQSAKPLLLLTREHVEFNRQSSFQLDVALFQKNLQQQRLAEAIALYQGELLSDLRSDSDRVEEWLVVQREHFQMLALGALQTLTEQALAQGDVAQAQVYARQQLTLEPWRERAHRQLMMALAAAGERSAALAHYETCRQLLQRELGVEPDVETEALVARIREGETRRQGEGEQGRKGEGDDFAIQNPNSKIQNRTDWGDMPEVAALQGREEEMAELERWLLRERCRMVTIVGMGGMGKTSLAAKATRQFAEHFDSVVWRSLLNAPPLPEILRGWLSFLDPQSATQNAHLANGEFENNLTQLFTLLRQQRCLLVLDNVESILQSDTRAGHYRSGYEGYGQLFKRIGETSHSSVLLLTSRETPQEAARLERESPAVRTLPLRGLSQQAGLAVLRRQGIALTTDAPQTVVARYSGNPLALMLVAETIHDLFSGNIQAFLGESAPIFDDIRDVLDQQFARLTALERDILLWLAIEREAIGLSQLSANLQPPVPMRLLIEALNSLRRRSLIEKSSDANSTEQKGADAQSGFLLQNVVTEYLTEYLVEQFCVEMQEQTPRYLKSHTLLKAQAKEYVRQSQIRLIVQPITERLLAKFGKARLLVLLQNLLTQLHKADDQTASYAGGNLLNLLIQLGIDPAPFDFSDLAIWQAYLADVTVTNLNFSNCNFKDCVFTDKFGALVAITFSPDGQQIAAGSSVGNIRIWRASDGQSLRVWQAHDNYIFSLFFSPDGKTLYSCSDDRHIRVWELEEIAGIDEIGDPPLRATLDGHERGVWRLALSGDGKLLLSSGGDGLVILWDALQGRQFAMHHVHNRGVRSLAIDPTGDLVASGDEVGDIVLWRLKTDEKFKLPRQHRSGILSLAFSPHGKFLASGGYDESIQLWDLTHLHDLTTMENSTQAEISSAVSHLHSHLFGRHTGRVTGLTFSPDGRLLASGSYDQSVRLWDVATAQVRHILLGHSDAIGGIAFSPNGAILASGSDDRSVRLWEVASGHALRAIRGHTQGVMGVALSPDGKLLATANQDHKVRIWHLPSSTMQNTLHSHQKEVATVAFHPTGDLLASGSADETIQLWDLRSNRLLRMLRGHKGWVRMLVFSRNGKELLSCSNDYTVRLWDVQSGAQLFEQAIQFSIWSAAQCGDEQTWVLGGTTGKLQLWNFAFRTPDQATQPLLTLHGHTNWVTTVACSPDGTLIASGSSDQLVGLWDAQSGERLHMLNGHSSWVYAVTFSPDGRWLASASADKTICLWDVQRQQLLRRLTGHDNEVRSLAFSADGNTLYSGSTDETVCCWDTKTGTCLAILRAPRPYEGMNISHTTGITPAKRRSLLALGAVE